MYSIKKRILCLAALTLALSQWPAAARAASSGDQLFSDPVIATGKGFQIKRSQLDEAYLNYDMTLAASGGSIPEGQRVEVRSNLLQHLILTQILMQKATAADRAEIQQLVQSNIDEARRLAPSAEAFEAQFKASGMTLAQVRDKAIEEQLCKLILQRATTNGIVISDAEAKKFCDENPEEFDRPETARVSHILISTTDPITQEPMTGDQKKGKEKLARSIKTRADNGEDFAALVKQYSDDPAMREKGGEFKIARHKMNPNLEPLEIAAFSMKVGQISDPVETRFGYHIIKLLEKTPARHEAFSEVEQKIKDFLLGREAQKAVPGYLAKIQVEANVALLDPQTGKPLPTSVK